MERLWNDPHSNEEHAEAAEIILQLQGGRTPAPARPPTPPKARPPHGTAPPKPATPPAPQVHPASARPASMSGIALAASAPNRLRQVVGASLALGAVESAVASPVARGAVYDHIPSDCPQYDHVQFMESSGAFALPLASMGFQTASVCNRPPSFVLGPNQDHYVMDVYDWLAGYPHTLRSTASSPTCTYGSWARHNLWPEAVLDGSLRHNVEEVCFLKHVSPLAKVEQGGGAVGDILGKPEITDNANNHGGYDKTMCIFCKGPFGRVEPTDVVPLAMRGRVPTRPGSSPDERSEARSRIDPRVGRAYAPMIAAGIRATSFPVAWSLNSEAYQAERRVLAHNYGLFAAQFAPAISEAAFGAEVRAPLLAIVPMIVTPAGIALMVTTRDGGAIFGAPLRDPMQLEAQANSLSAFLGVGIEPQYASTSRVAPHDVVFCLPWDHEPLVVLRSAAELRSAAQSGSAAAWCTLPALVDSVAHALYGLAITRVQQMNRPMSSQPLIVGIWEGARPVVPRRQSAAFGAAAADPAAATIWTDFLDAERRNGLRLQQVMRMSGPAPGVASMAVDVRTCADYAAELAVPNGLPDFSDPCLNWLPVPQRPPPLCTSWLCRLPDQCVPEGMEEFDYNELLRGWARRVGARHANENMAWDAHCCVHGAPPTFSRPAQCAIGPGGAKMLRFADGIGGINAFSIIWEKIGERRFRPLDFSKALEVNWALKIIAHHIGKTTDREVLGFLFDGCRFKLDDQTSRTPAPRQIRHSRNLTSYGVRARGVAKAMQALVAADYMALTRMTPVTSPFQADVGPVPYALIPGFQTPIGGEDKADKPGEARCVGNMGDPPTNKIWEINSPEEPLAGSPAVGDPVVNLNDLGGKKGGVEAAVYFASDYDGPVFTFPDKEPKHGPLDKCALIAYLKHCCFLLGLEGDAADAFIVCHSDDIRHMFFQFPLARSERWMSIFYLVCPFTDEFGVETLWYCSVVNSKMNMGWRPASQIACRFAEEWLEAWRVSMDRFVANVWLPAQPAAYREAHRARCELLGSAQARPFGGFVFTDNYDFCCLGPVLATVGLGTWKLMNGIACIKLQTGPETFGTCSKWVGQRTLVNAGLACLMPDKEARLHKGVADAVAPGGCDFEAYESVASFLSWAGPIQGCPEEWLSGIHRPLKGRDKGDVVLPSAMVCEKLRRIAERFRDRPLASCWVGVKDAFVEWDGAESSRRSAITMSSDSCAEPQPVEENAHPIAHVCGVAPGLYWRFPLTGEWEERHITLTEGLGPLINMMVLMPLFPGAECVLGVDATAAAVAPLAKGSKSENLQLALHLVEGSGLIDQSCMHAWIDHWKGVGNGLADKGSRDQMQAMHRLASSYGMQLVEVVLSPPVLAVLAAILVATRPATTGATAAGVSNLNMRPSPIAHLLPLLGGLWSLPTASAINGLADGGGQGGAYSHLPMLKFFVGMMAVLGLGMAALGLLTRATTGVACADAEVGGIAAVQPTGLALLDSLEEGGGASCSPPPSPSWQQIMEDVYPANAEKAELLRRRGVGDTSKFHLRVVAASPRMPLHAFELCIKLWHNQPEAYGIDVYKAVAKKLRQMGAFKEAKRCSLGLRTRFSLSFCGVPLAVDHGVITDAAGCDYMLFDLSWLTETQYVERYGYGTMRDYIGTKGLTRKLPRGTPGGRLAATFPRTPSDRAAVTDGYSGGTWKPGPDAQMHERRTTYRDICLYSEAAYEARLAAPAQHCPTCAHSSLQPGCRCVESVCPCRAYKFSGREWDTVGGNCECSTCVEERRRRVEDGVLPTHDPATSAYCYCGEYNSEALGPPVVEGQGVPPPLGGVGLDAAPPGRQSKGKRKETSEDEDADDWLYDDGSQPNMVPPPPPAGGQPPANPGAGSSSNDNGYGSGGDAPPPPPPPPPPLPPVPLPVDPYDAPLVTMPAGTPLHQFPANGSREAVLMTRHTQSWAAHDAARGSSLAFSWSPWLSSSGIWPGSRCRTSSKTAEIARITTWRSVRWRTSLSPRREPP